MATLQQLATAPAGPERVWATLALARAAAMQGDWGAAGEWLHRLDLARDLVAGLGMVRPLAFTISVALRNHDHAGVQQGLALLRTMAGAGAGKGSEWHLLRAGQAALPGDFTGWSAALTPLYRPAGLAAPIIAAPGHGTGAAPFDRLVARPRQMVADGPLVSVLMPARNAAATIDTALAGLVAQGWRNLEILVIDNGSTDATAARVADWQARDPRIRRLDGAAAAGAYGARNLGRDAARGEFLTLHDADDWAHPDRIATQMAGLHATGAPAAMTHWLRLADDLWPGALRPDVAMLHANLSSLLIRADAAATAGYWDEVTAGADSEYVARLHRRFGVGAVAMVRPGVPLAFGRITTGSLSQAAATGLFGAGAAARAAYQEAAARWHATAPMAALALPRRPATRPFPAPAALLPGPAGSDLTPDSLPDSRPDSGSAPGTAPETTAETALAAVAKPARCPKAPAAPPSDPSP